MTPLSKRKTNKSPIHYGSASGFENRDNSFIFSDELPVRSKYRQNQDRNKGNYYKKKK